MKGVNKCERKVRFVYYVKRDEFKVISEEYLAKKSI